MKPEEKDLLIVDLCGRLPYEVNVFYHNDDWETKHDVLSAQKIDMLLRRSDVVIKPYLRTMSSMTEEEKYDYITNVKKEKCIVELPILPKIEAIDWLNAHHFDYRGLIEKGLAIEVTEENNPYKD